MATTILTEPQSFTPSDNDIVWTFSSDQSSQPNFAFLVKVFINSVNVGNHLIFPEYGGNRAHYNAQDDARIYCTRPNIDATVFATAANNTGEIYIEVYDYYGDPAEIQGSPDTSATLRFFKAALSDVDFVNWDASEYIMNPNSKWLTFYPRAQQLLCSMTENLFMMFITNGDDCNVEITIYDENDNVISSDNPSIGSTGIDIMIMNLSPTMLLANTVFTPTEIGNTSYYTIAISNTAVELSETMTVYIDRRCDKYGTKRLHYITSIGSIDAFSFILANKETREVKSSSYEKQLGGFTAGGTYVYDLTEGRESDYIKTSKGRMTVNSDFIEEEMQNYLVRELYESPMVLVEESSQLVRYRVLNTGYEKKKRKTDVLFNEVVELGLNDHRKSVLL